VVVAFENDKAGVAANFAPDGVEELDIAVADLGAAQGVGVRD